ncbi:HNH endonuclease [Novosphingobium subterraneum]|uniref:HNH endonuclease n=1 Tax=Novosphingobium subterraneum TaxID=48936 RepID=UPI003CFF571E
MSHLDRLVTALSYNPTTGEFRWLRNVNARAREGNLAGSISKTSGYLQIRFEGKLYYGHRLAWYITHGVWVDRIDHRDNCRSNNKIVNLRPCTHMQNNRNGVVRGNNTSGFKGVSLNKHGSYVAKITCNRKEVRLGSYKDPVAAALAYDKAANDLHSTFAKTNRMMGLI